MSEHVPASQGQDPHSHDEPSNPQHRGGSRRAMVSAFFLTASFMGAEFVGGILSNSLALVADATHMLSDAAALGLGLAAMYMATQPHTEKRSFGWHRAEILAALLNGAMLLVLSGLVAWHAIERFNMAQTIDDRVMLVIAFIGLGVNLVAMRLLGHHSHQSLNIRGAYLHVLGDALGSVGVIVAAFWIRWTGWTAIDSVVSILIALLVGYGGWRLVRETVSVLLESSPAHLSADQIQGELSSLNGVKGIHDFHVWTVTSGFISLSCHVEIAAGTDSDRVIRDATTLLHERHGIQHVTIQPETEQVHEALEHCCASDHPAAPTLSEFLLGR